MTVNFSGIHNAMYLQFYTKKPGLLKNYVQCNLNDFGAEHHKFVKPLLEKFPHPNDKTGTLLNISASEVAFPHQDPELMINNHPIKALKNLDIVNKAMQALDLIKVTHNSQFTKHPNAIEDSMGWITKITNTQDQPLDKRVEITKEKYNVNNIKTVSQKMWNTLQYIKSKIN